MKTSSLYLLLEWESCHMWLWRQSPVPCTDLVTIQTPFGQFIQTVENCWTKLKLLSLKPGVRHIFYLLRRFQTYPHWRVYSKAVLLCAVSVKTPASHNRKPEPHKSLYVFWETYICFNKGLRLDILSNIWLACELEELLSGSKLICQRKQLKSRLFFTRFLLMRV